MKTYPYKDIYPNVHSSLICNSQKIKRIQMSFKWGMDEQILIYQYSGRVFCSKNTQIMDSAITWLNLKSIMIIKRIQTHTHEIPTV